MDNADEVQIVPYDPRWPELFQREKAHLLSCLPAGLIRRIEHFGSTAVSGMAAKPIIDMLVEVTSLDETRQKIVPILTSQGYAHFWSPRWGPGTPRFYVWFIKRNGQGVRTHHVHMVERDFPHWDRLLFRDYLILHPEIAAEYTVLRMRLVKLHPHNRQAYTKGKTEFITRITEEARCFYKSSLDP